jgi:hypothetical protein
MRRRNWQRSGTIALLTVGLAAVQSLAGPAPASALELRYKFKPGALIRYRVMVAAGALAQTPMAPEPVKMQFTMDMRMVQKVLTVSKSGIADQEWTTTQGTMKMTAAGRTNSSKMEREVSRLKLTDRGKLLSYHTLGGDAAPAASAGPVGFDQADPMRALAGLNFPDRDVKPGDTWASESKVDLGGGQSRVMKIASRFVGLARYKGRQCARIQTAFEMPMDVSAMTGEAEGVTVKSQGKITGQIMTLFDYTAGRELYADGSVIMLVKMKMSGAMDPTSVGQSLDMNNAMKLNVRQILID